MNEHSPIYHETQAISPLVAGVGNQNPYQTPDGYFDAFPLELMASKFAESLPATEAKSELSGLSPLLASSDPITPYTVPAEYFPALDQQSLEGVKAVDFVQETLNNPSVLSQPESRQTPYTVPDQYFESLPILVCAKVSAQPAPAPVVRMTWMRYAVAAALVGLLALVGWMGWLAIQTPTSIPELVQVEQSIQAVNDEELASFIQQQNPLVQTDLAVLEEGLSDADIQSILSEYADEELLQFMHGSLDENSNEEN